MCRTTCSGILVKVPNKSSISPGYINAFSTLDVLSGPWLFEKYDPKSIEELMDCFTVDKLLFVHPFLLFVGLMVT